MEPLRKKRKDEKKKVLDLRSDTVTHPTPAMRRAMAEAEVGDDVIGDDMTVKLLEEQGAAFLGKEAALFVPSGTMGNLLSIMCHCEKRGSELIVGDHAHIHVYEAGGSAAIAGVHARVLPNDPDGTISLERIAEAVRPLDDHYPASRLLCLENTHNGCGGKVVPVAYIQKAAALAHSQGMKVHMDGARLCNAAAALGVSPADIVRDCDSVSMCLSKGLAAPVGSLLAGSSAFITLARRMRKSLGGGMRQAGVLAAPALLSLSEMWPRIGEDNANAKTLARGLAAIPGVVCNPADVESNMVFLSLASDVVRDVPTFVAAVKAHGIIIAPKGPYKFRLVTHYHVELADVNRIITAFEQAVAAARVAD